MHQLHPRRNLRVELKKKGVQVEVVVVKVVNETDKIRLPVMIETVVVEGQSSNSIQI
jgi:hypothetical protein